MFDICRRYTGCLNIYGTHVTVLLFLPIQYLYTYRVSQYIWDPCDCPNISAHSIFLYIQGVSIYIGPMWLSYYFCPFNISIHTGCLNIHGTNVVLLFLPIQYLYTYRVSQYTWDLCDCPIISAHSIFLYIQGVSIYMGPMWLSYYFCPFNTFIYSVSQYTWDLCDCPIISAHSILFLYIQDVSIYKHVLTAIISCPYQNYYIKVVQYTWDLCDCPIISAHSITF